MTDPLLTVRVSLTPGLRFRAEVDTVIVLPPDYGEGPMLRLAASGDTPVEALRRLTVKIEGARFDKGPSS